MDNTDTLFSTNMFDMDFKPESLSLGSSDKADDLGNILDDLLGSSDETKEEAFKNFGIGLTLKTISAASDLFNRGVAALSGNQEENIRDSADVAILNYDNQMASLDNQVLYLKNQLSDRFNKTIETNMMNLAARNIRVNAGNVMELSKDMATEITEDMNMADSNARLKKIALEAKKESTKESRDYAIKQMWTGLATSAAKLGIMGAAASDSWGDLFKGLRIFDAVKKQQEVPGAAVDMEQALSAASALKE